MQFSQKNSAQILEEDYDGGSQLESVDVVCLVIALKIVFSFFTCFLQTTKIYE